jgi:2-oxoglutarate dehydrogenase E1 component
MYDMFKSNPDSVHTSWRAYFSNVESGSKEPFMPAPPVASDVGEDIGMLNIRDSIKVYTMARAYQTRGHEIAKTDPLQLTLNVKGSTVDTIPEGLDPAYFGFTT